MLFAAVVLPWAAVIVWQGWRRRLVPAAAGLLVLLVTRASDLGVTYHHWPSLAQPLVLLVAVVVFVRRTRGGSSRSFGPNATFWSAAAVYLAVVTASAIWATDGHAAVGQAGELARNLLIVYVVAEVFETRQAQIVAVWAFLAAGGALAALSVVQAATHTFSYDYLGFAQAHLQQIVGATNGYRSAGPIGDANFYGLVLASLVPLAVLRVRDEARRRMRLLALGCLLLLLAATALTYSRGALLALLVGSALLVSLLHVPGRVVVRVAIVAVALFAVLPAHYRERIVVASNGDHAVAERVASQRVALAMFADHPLGGVGADNYRATYRPYALRLDAPDAASTVHDLYLATAAETGLAGAATFLVAVGAVLVSGWSRRRTLARSTDRSGEGLATGAVVALAVYLCGSAFVPIAYPRYLWLLAGLVLAVCGPVDQPADPSYRAAVPVALP